jgi:hypothetical protein
MQMELSCQNLIFAVFNISLVFGILEFLNFFEFVWVF